MVTVWLLWEQPIHVKDNPVLAEARPPLLKGVFDNPQTPGLNAESFNEKMRYRTRWVTPVEVEG